MVEVLLIGPDVVGMPRLDVTAELTAIGDLRNVSLTTLLGADVSADRVVERAQRQRYDLVIWSGHGYAGALLLSDGRPVTPHWLANQLARHGTALVILAACLSSLRPEQRMLSLGFADVLPRKGITTVAMALDVLDTAAVQYNIAFAQSLAAGADVDAAHDAGLERAALAGNAAAPQLYRGTGAKADMAGLQYPGGDQMLQALSVKMDHLSDQVHALNVDQQVTKADVARIKDDMGSLRNGVTVPKLYMGVIGGVLVLLLLLQLLPLVRTI